MATKKEYIESIQALSFDIDKAENDDEIQDILDSIKDDIENLESKLELKDTI